ncbi:CHAT domain-containing protein [Streptomyces bobili]|uniref:CHAT domain-containing protein n=1 Tax=Streptomyces bobili TaxID=67280 RepID=UPI0033DAF3FB
MLANTGLAHHERFTRTGDLADLDACIEFVGRAAAILPRSDPRRGSRLVDLAVGRMTRFELTREDADLNGAIADLEAAEGILPDPTVVWRNLIAAYLLGFQTRGLRSDLDAAIRNGELGRLRTHVRHPERPAILSNLSTALRLRAALRASATDLGDAARLSQEAVSMTSDDDPELPGFLASLGAVFLAVFRAGGTAADLDRAVAEYRRATDLVAPGDPKTLECLSGLSDALRTRFPLTGAARDIEDAEHLDRRLLALLPARHPDRCAALAGLGATLNAKFSATERLDDLQDAIRCYEQAVAIAPPGHPQLPVFRLGLGIGLYRRWRHIRVPAELDRAETEVAAAVDGPADRAEVHHTLATIIGAREDPGRLDDLIVALEQATVLAGRDSPWLSDALADLSLALRDRFHSTGSRPDVDGAISAAREALDLLPAEARTRPERLLADLGTVLALRFDTFGDARDLEESITRLRASATMSPVPSTLNNLGNVLITRFTRSGSATDLNEAINAYYAVVDAASDERTADLGATLSNTGYALRERYGLTADPADLEAAIHTGRQAVAILRTGDSALPGALENLATSLGSRFERTGDVTDLDQAIEALRESLTLTLPRGVGRVGRMSNLANSLRLTFERTGDLAYVDEAITLLRELLATFSPEHPDWPGFLSNLTSNLHARAAVTGSLADLNEAVEAGARAVDDIPARHVGRPGLVNNLGTSLQTRFERTGDPSDLDEAITRLRQAAHELPDTNPVLPGILGNLANGLRNRFATTGDPGALDEAVDIGRRATGLLTAQHPQRPGVMAGLGAALGLRFQQSGNPADLGGAISLYQEALATTPDAHPLRARVLHDLGGAYAARSALTGDAADLATAVDVLERAGESETAATSVRLTALWSAGTLAAATDPGRAARLLARAVGLLPAIAPRRLDRPDQQHALGQYGGLASAAAALALDDPSLPEGERPTAALRLLESGRAVLLSQSLETRSALTELASLQPELAARFTLLRDRLDRPSDDLTEETAAQPGIHDRVCLVAEWADLLGTIRALPGFATFAQPPSHEELAELSAHGPVVVFNVSEHRGDALLLTPEGVSVQPLPGLTRDTLVEQITDFHDALETTNDPDASHGTRVVAQQRLSSTLGWLWDHVTGPALTALTLDVPPDGRLPRVWWIPGGLLGLLPVHAAGHHRDGTGRTVIDRVVSSYAPTLQALRFARSQPTASGPALVIAMPTTPNVPEDLPNAADEAEFLTAHLPGSTLLTSEGTAPTRQTVVELLPSHPIAHFACHGISDQADPSRSRLLLHDHQHDPFTVMALAPIRLDQAYLAFLSACETALTTDARLLDEAIHLASAFQLAGYPHVIGTLWSIADDAAFTLTKAFYQGLPTKPPANALHDAVRSLRDRSAASPSLWASHIHIGA